MLASSTTYRPKLVAQIVEAMIVRIVRGAHRVEVEAFHQHEVFAHVVDADIVLPCTGWNSWRLTPRMNTRAPLISSDLSRTSMRRKPMRCDDRFDHRAVGRDEFGDDAIQLRRFVRPRRDAAHFERFAHDRAGMQHRRHARRRGANDAGTPAPRRRARGAPARGRSSVSTRYRSRQPASTMPPASPSIDSVPRFRSSVSPAVTRRSWMNAVRGAVQMDAAMDAGLPPLVLVLDVSSRRTSGSPSRRARSRRASNAASDRTPPASANPSTNRRTRRSRTRAARCRPSRRATRRGGRASSTARETSCGRVRSGCAPASSAARTETASRRSCSADGRSPAAPTCPAPRIVAPRRVVVFERREILRRRERRIDEPEAPRPVERHAPRRFARRARRCGRRIRRQRHAHRQPIQRNALRHLPHRRSTDDEHSGCPSKRRRWRRLTARARRCNDPPLSLSCANFASHDETTKSARAAICRIRRSIRASSRGLSTTAPRKSEHMAGDSEEPPYATGLAALRDGWRLLQMAPLQPHAPGAEFTTAYLKYEFLFEQWVDVDG